MGNKSIPKITNILSLSDLTCEQANTIINNIPDNRVFLTVHARERMEERRITTKQVLYSVRNGRYVEEPFRATNGNWKMTKEASNSGDVINAVFAIDTNSDGDHILVMTTY